MATNCTEKTFTENIGRSISSVLYAYSDVYDDSSTNDVSRKSSVAVVVLDLPDDKVSQMTPRPSSPPPTQTTQCRTNIYIYLFIIVT